MRGVASIQWAGGARGGRRGGVLVGPGKDSKAGYAANLVNFSLFYLVIQ